MGVARDLAGPHAMLGGSGPVGGFRFSTGEKAALVAFLKTLTDPSVTTDPKFQDPFNYGD